MGNMRKLVIGLAIVLLLAVGAVPLGCAGGAYSYDDFIDDLRDSGASVEIGEASDHQGIISPFLANTKNNIKVNGENVNIYEYDNEVANTKNNIKVNGENVNIYEYDNEALADEDAAHVHPDGFGYERIDNTGKGYGVQWSWVGHPHFYKNGRIIVIYVDVSRGSDPTVRNLLENILGQQFAGAA
jgi:hypothetical protein